MSARPPIIVETPGHLPQQDWRRFVASLCFIEFYVRLVECGTNVHARLADSTALWDHTPYGQGCRLWLLASVCSALRAICIYGLGRALWRHKPAGRWVLRVAAFSAVQILLFTLSEAVRQPTGWPSSFMPEYWFGGLLQLINPLVLRAVFENVHHLPWLALFLFWAVRRKSISWAGVAAVTSVFLGSLQFLPEDMIWWRGVGRTRYELPAIVTGIYLVMPLATAILLFLRNSRAFLPAAFTLFSRTTFIFALFACWFLDGVPRPINHPALLLNQRFFFIAFVWSAELCGPWLVIAWYAWRMRRNNIGLLAASEYPRWHCWQCGYDLHGVLPAACPECGAELDMDVGQAVTVA